MKKILCMILAFCMLLPIFASCDKDNEATDSEKATEAVEQTPDTDEPSDTDKKPNTENKKPSKEEEEPVYITKAEKYMPTDVRSYYEKALSEKSVKFSCYDTANASYAMQDVPTISSITLKRISIPVYKTESLGSDGKFTFTLFVHSNSLAGMKNTALRKYELKIDPSTYELAANATVMKYIDVDVSGQNITVRKGEALAMFAPTDTIVPAYMRVADPTNSSALNEVAECIAEKFPQAQNGYERVGKQTMGLTSNIHLYDFEYDKTYVESELKAAEEEQKQYESLVAMLKEKYSGKYVSVLGDSISTFDGLSNNSAHNTTLIHNLPHYKPSTTSPSIWEQTYWGRVIKETGMQLCVSNAWGGATLYGRHEPTNSSWDWTNYKDSAPNRASQLHRNDGTKPDVIIMYMGINDLHRGDGFPHGEIYKLLKDVDRSDYEQYLDFWFDSVLESTNNGRFLVPGQSYKSIEQAYALALYIMQQNYPDAEIICIGLLKNGNGVCTDEHMMQYNFAIEAIAEYFGAIYVDQNGLVKENELHYYGTDVTCVHPNSMGMELLSRKILMAWGESERKK